MDVADSLLLARVADQVEPVGQDAPVLAVAAALYRRADVVVLVGDLEDELVHGLWLAIGLLHREGLGAVRLPGAVEDGDRALHHLAAGVGRVHE